MASETGVVSSFKYNYTVKSVLLTWESDFTEQANWRVTASKDGKSYHSVGQIWGRNPRNPEAYIFRLSMNKKVDSLQFFDLYRKIDKQWVLMASCRKNK